MVALGLVSSTGRSRKARKVAAADNLCLFLLWHPAQLEAREENVATPTGPFEERGETRENLTKPRAPLR